MTDAATGIVLEKIAVKFYATDPGVVEFHDFILPLTSPVLIFGTRAVDMAVHGESTLGPLYLLAALAVFSISLGPLAASAALKVAME